MRWILIAVLAVGVARGQTPSGGGVMGGMSPMGSRGPQYMPEAIVGKPYTMVRQMHSVWRVPGYKRPVWASELREMRDGKGRVRVEMPDSGSGTVQPVLVLVIDPVARTQVMMHVQAKKAKVAIYPERPVLTAEQKKRAAELEQAVHAMLQEEVLEPMTVDGVYAEGRRRTVVFPVMPTGVADGKVDADGRQRTVSETWFSKELGIEIANHTVTPKLETSTGATEIHRGEPEASLFLVPAGYEVTEVPPAQFPGEPPA